MKADEVWRWRPFFTVVFLVFCLSFVPGGESDLVSDKATLINLQRALGGRTLRWNLSLPLPCSWLGVTCASGGVTELRLPGAGLSGELPLGIGNLTQLQKLSLRFNALTGSVPPDFANLVALSELHLEGNFFSGSLPGFLFGMQSLVRLNLGDNKFTGEISPGFNNLTKLVVLFLNNNNFSGSIPELDLPALEEFNVSFNKLNGSIPEKLSGLPANSFDGNSLCGKPLKPCNGTEIVEKNKKKKLSGGVIAGIVIACVVFFLFILAIMIFFCRRKDRGEKGSKEIASKSTELGIPSGKSTMDIESSSADYSSSAVAKASVKKNGGNRSLVFFGNAVRVFDLEDLLRASAEVLGKGTFGTAYKATLEMGVAVAVKRLKEASVPEKEFREKLEDVGRMDHENLVPLRAYYYSRDEKLLVYDYMPMGSLSALLHGNSGAGRTPLNWETRSGIALGAARGIEYLHSQGRFSSHGNIKSSNILLTKSYEARVSDFGLAHLASPNSAPNRIAGYRAPEVTDPHKVSPKADVYSFGVLLLELLTGKPPTHSQLNEEGVDLPRWVQSVVREEWTAEVFDLELLRYQNVEEEMVELLQIALECTMQYPDKRPSMAEVTKRIEDLCRSSSQQEGNVANESFYGTDEGISQQYYSTDASIPPSPKD
ncbi:Tyrosine-protein kinase [Parasponia andersonii]|uniref:Tyrosine-protein kinase n=1 Tax=Parasponia andersonii TaxID=3476 RepID=A0A2P5C3C7_PARAD|nr:Tyrosine-protein kinase [Parasponia andersonii]